VTSGRYEAHRYVLDPSACIKRFTHTPSARRASEGEGSLCPVAQQASGGQPAAPTATEPDPAAPCPKYSDAVACEPVSEKAAHAEMATTTAQDKAAKLHEQLADGVAEHITS
jgi:hypothetical protein